METKIFELSDDEISAISGGSQIDPPAQAEACSSGDFPEIENVPPG